MSTIKWYRKGNANARLREQAKLLDFTGPALQPPKRLVANRPVDWKHPRHWVDPPGTAARERRKILESRKTRPNPLTGNRWKRKADKWKSRPGPLKPGTTNPRLLQQIISHGRLQSGGKALKQEYKRFSKNLLEAHAGTVSKIREQWRRTLQPRTEAMSKIGRQRLDGSYWWKRK